MKLNIVINEHAMDIVVSADTIKNNAETYLRLNEEMDKGLQIGAYWHDKPSIKERCQSAADKLLQAIEQHNEGLAMMTAGYILTTLENVSGVTINTHGEPIETSFRYHSS